MKTLSKKSMTRKIDFGKKTHLMGILNITPDSFYDGGNFYNDDKAIARALEIEKEGADILDVGGESSRPGSEPVSIQEEIRRVIPVITRLKEALHIPISLDSSRSEVIKEALVTGSVSIINDIYACRRDPRIIDLILENNLYLIIMHMKGDPKTMQVNPFYEDVISEIMNFFEERIKALIHRGVKEEKIILDPGIGFGKRLEDNLRILKNISAFKNLGFPVLIGPSRKSFIGMITGRPPEQRLFGTAAAVSCCVLNGADILRLHDIKEMQDVIKITEKLRKL